MVMQPAKAADTAKLVKTVRTDLNTASSSSPAIDDGGEDASF
jgi:hypothetical protein